MKNLKRKQKQKQNKDWETPKRVVPYDTGKVKIGLLYQPPKPPMSADEERIQAGLMGWNVTTSVPWKFFGAVVFILAVLLSSVKRFL